MPARSPIADFPLHRPRRLRTSAALRDLVAETNVGVTDLIAPLFVREGIDRADRDRLAARAYSRTPATACVARWSSLAEMGVRAIMLFGVPATKDDTGSGAYDPRRHRAVGAGRSARRGRRRRRADGRPVRRRVHQPRPLRHRRRRRHRRQRRHPRDLRQGSARPGRCRRPRRRPERHDGRPGRGDPCGARRRADSARSRSSGTRPSTPAVCTGRFATRSTSASPTAATARATSRTSATPARRWSRSTPISPRAPTW